MTLQIKKSITLCVCFIFLFFSSQTIAQPGTGVNGHNVTIVKYSQNGGGSFTNQGNKTWVENTVQSQFNFKEVGRDEWSVYLRSDARKLSVQLDLWQKKIYLTVDGQKRFVLYPISDAKVNTPDISAANGPAGYQRCAKEGESNTFSSPTDIAYGSKGKYEYRKAITGTVTFNNQTFGDPNPGVPKFGYRKDAERPQDATPAGYTKCAKEGETNNFNQPTDVAYGSRGKYKYRTAVTGNLTFNNQTFGDPNPGVVKYGFCKKSSITVVSPPVISDKEVEVEVWEMKEKDLKAITTWIKSRVASVRVPYCYRDSYGRGAGSVASGCANSTLEKDATGGPAGLCYPKCKTGYYGVGPLCWQSCPTNFRDDGAFCRKPDEYGRGAGRIPDKRPCSDWNSAYRDDGTSCWLDTYGRGTGFDYFFKDGMKNCEKKHGKGNCEMWGAIAYPKCKKGYKNVACCLCEPIAGPGIKVTAFERYKCRSNEELNGALCYPKCKSGYSAVGCCICSYDCPADFGEDIGVSCTKKTYGRGVGELSTCPPNLIRDETGGPAGLCYPRCKRGYHGVGPVCWMNCPDGLTECGAGCAASDFDCASTTFDQVFSVAIATANIATLGLSKPATTGLKAGQTSVKVGSKVFVTSSKIGKYSAKAVAAMQQVDEGVHTGKVVVKYVKKKLHNPGAVIAETREWTETAYNAYMDYETTFVNSEFVNQTSKDINRELVNRLHPEYVKTVKRYYAKVVLAEFAKNEIGIWDVAEYGLLAAGMADPTGLVDVATAYAHPVCDTVEPFPNVDSKYLK